MRPFKRKTKDGHNESEKRVQPQRSASDFLHGLTPVYEARSAAAVNSAAFKGGWLKRNRRHAFGAADAKKDTNCGHCRQVALKHPAGGTHLHARFVHVRRRGRA